MAAVSAAGVDAFGVNVFMPGHRRANRVPPTTRFARSRGGRRGGVAGRTRWDDDDYPAKVAAVLARPPAAVSFTFGVPDTELVRSLQAAGSLVVLTVTTPEEAGRALALGPTRSASRAWRRALTGEPGQRRPADEDRPLHALARRGPASHLGPAGCGGWRRRPRRRRRPARPGRNLVQAWTAFLRCPESGAPPASRTRWAMPGQGAHRGHAGLQRAEGPHWSTTWCGPTRGHRRPTPRSTTRPGPSVRCGAAGDRALSLLPAGPSGDGGPSGRRDRGWLASGLRREQAARDHDHRVRPPDVAGSPTRWSRCGPPGAAGSTCCRASPKKRPRPSRRRGSSRSSATGRRR